MTRAGSAVILVGLGALGCAPPTAVVVERVGEAVTPGMALHVDTDHLPEELVVELEHDGRRSPLRAEEAWFPDYGAVYRIPADAAPGAATVWIRERAEAEASATAREVDVLAPGFAAVALPTTHARVDDVQLHAAGVCAADVDGDGDTDLFFANGRAPATLLRNETTPGRAPRFVDATDALFGDARPESGGPRGGCAFADVDGDGDPDLALGYLHGPDRLYVNELVESGAPAFRDRAAALGFSPSEQSTAGFAFGDYDADGDLDVYVLHAVYGPRHGALDNVDRLYRQEDGRFVDVTAALADPSRPGTTSLAAAWIDADADGDLDLLVASDHRDIYGGTPNLHYRNDGPDGAGPGGHAFAEVGRESGFANFPDGKGRRMNSMGLALGDVDGDGRVDALLTNIGPNALLGFDGERFVDRAASLGVARATVEWLPEGPFGWSVTWGAHLEDWDNDGDVDAFLVGGAQPGWFGPRQVPHALLLQGPDGFVDASVPGGVLDPGVGLASTRLDVDRDGALDVVVVGSDGPATLFWNRMGGPSWLEVVPRGTRSTTDAVGAVVTARCGERAQVCFVNAGPSYGASAVPLCHFGLGACAEPEAPVRVEIRWPRDGLVTRHALTPRRRAVVLEP